MQQNKMVNRKDEKSSMENEPQGLDQEGMEESDLNKSKMGPDYKQTDRPGWKEDLGRDKQLHQQTGTEARRGGQPEVSGKDLEFDGRKAEIDVGKERTYKEGANPDWKVVAGRDKQLGEQKESDKDLRYAGLGRRRTWATSRAGKRKREGTSSSTNQKGRHSPGKRAASENHRGSNLPSQGSTSGEGSPQGR